MNYRRKTTLVLGLLALALTSIMLTLHLGYLAYGIFRDSKAALKQTCRRVRHALAEQHCNLKTPLSQDIHDNLTKKLDFTSEELNCVILNHDRKIVFQKGELYIPVDKLEFGNVQPYDTITDIPHQQESRAFYINGVTMHRPQDEWTDLMQGWHVMERIDMPGGAVFIDTEVRFELLEHFAEGAVISFILAILLLFSANLFFRRRFFHPLEATQQALAQIRNGQLETRIPLPDTQDELTLLIQGLNDTFGDLENAITKARQFSNDAAHELRTPLTVIRGNLEVSLEHPRSPAEYQQTLSDILSEVASLSQMIDTLLIMTRIERHVGVKEAQDVTAIVQSSAEWIANLTEEHNQNLVSSIAPGVTMNAVPGLLERLCRNLLVNAVRYSPEGATIECRLEKHPRSFDIIVSDTGIGIAEEYQERIFERFFRCDASTDDGHGLGLPLVKYIAEYHGGHVSIASQPGKGSTFTVSFPL